MAGSKSNYLSKKLLDAVLGQNSAIPGFAAAMTTVYVGLWVAAGTLTDTSSGSTTGEPGTGALPGGAYSRVAVTNNATNWPAATGTTVGAKSNGAPITFATATGVSGWGTVNQFAIVDNSSGGDILYWSDLTTPKAIAQNDTASFAIGALSITED